MIRSHRIVPTFRFLPLTPRPLLFLTMLSLAALVMSTLPAPANAGQPRVQLAKATDAEKKQKKIDKATAKFEKKLEKTRTSYLVRLKPEALARKKIQKIEKTPKSFEGIWRGLKKAGAPDADIDVLKKKLEVLLDEIRAAHRVASIDAVKVALEKKIDAKSIKRILENGDRAEQKAAAQYEKDVAKLEALNAPAADIEAVRKRRVDVMAAAKSASLDAFRDRARSRIKTPADKVEARFGAPTIVAEAPTWCAGVLEKIPAKFWQSYAPPKPPDISDRLFTLDDLEKFAKFSCYDAAFPLRQQWVASFRQRLSNQFMLSNEHNSQVLKMALAAVVDDHFERNERKKLCDATPPKTTGTREEIASQHLERIALGCGNRLNRENAFSNWDLDVKDGFKSQLARAAFVSITLPNHRLSSTDSIENTATYRATEYVIASAVPLDAKQFEQELSKMRLSDFGQARARMHFYSALGNFNDYTRGLKSAAKRTPGIASLVFTGPRASLKKYKQEHKASKGILDAVLAVEDGLQSPNAMTGCGKSLFKSFKPYIKGVAAKQKGVPPHQLRLDGMKGFLLAYGLTICGLKDESAPVMDYTFGAFYYRMSPVKGPLSAAYRGMVEGYNVAIGSQKTGSFSATRGSGGGGASKLPTPRTNPMKPPSFPASTHGHMSVASLDLIGSAVVKKTKRKGSDVVVSFGTKKWKEDVLSCKETNKISRIGTDGKIHYRYKCKKTGTKMMSFTQKPITVPTWAAAGVKPGALIRFMRYPNGVKQDRGWVVETFATPQKKRRTGLLGAPL